MKKLDTIDADTLLGIPYEPLSFVVEDLLPQGLHLLAGAPKIGKSWLALWLCLRIAQGKPLWNFATKSCEVLYLCLEDSFQRIQSRLLDLTEDAPATLHFAVMSEQLHSGLGVSFRRAAEASIRYMLYSRCVEDPQEYFEPEDFMDVFDFNTQAASNVLGTAVSEISSQVFREVERAIRTYERAKQVEQEERSRDDDGTDLHADRGLPDPGHSAGGDGEPSAGQVRQDAQGVPVGEQPASLQPSGADREAVPAPVGGAGHGDSPDPADDGRAAGNEPGAGQETEADGLDPAHERAESPGGGDRDGGAYQQLTLEGMFPSEMEQISLIDREAESEKPSAFSIPNEEIDRILRQGSAYDGGKLRTEIEIAWKFQDVFER